MNWMTDMTAKRETGSVALNAGTEQIRVTYRLTTEWIEASGEPIYGVEIEAEPTGECVALRALSTDGQRVETLLAALMRGAVTPLTAADVVYDWLIGEEGSRLPVESR